MSFNTESIKIYKHLSFTTSELKEDLHTYKYWYFKLVRSYMQYDIIHNVYNVYFINSRENYEFLTDYENETEFSHIGCYILNKNCLKELCQINNLYVFTNRLLLCENLSYYNPVCSLHFYCPPDEERKRPGSDIDMNRDFNNYNISNDDPNLMIIVVTVISFTGDDVGSYVPEIKKYVYNFNDNLFTITIQNQTSSREQIETY